jgi:hypothetical protein
MLRFVLRDIFLEKLLYLLSRGAPCLPKVQQGVSRPPDLNQQAESKKVTGVRFVIFDFRVLGRYRVSVREQAQI